MKIINLDETTLKQREQEIFLSNENYLENTYLVEKNLGEEKSSILCYTHRSLFCI